jgi:superfamily II DNA or RNA helicase
MILGLTATLERLDGKEYIIKEYCPVCDEVTIEDALQNN